MANFLGIGGKGFDGTAKEMGFTNDNYSHSNNFKRVELIDRSTALDAGTVLETPLVEINEGDFSASHGLLNLHLDYAREVKISIVYQVGTTVDEETVLLVSEERKISYQIPYEVSAPKFFFKIENIDSAGTNVSPTTHTLLTQREFLGKKVDDLLKNNIVKRRLKPDDIGVPLWDSRGEVFESDMLDAPNHTVGRLNVFIGQQEREIKITKINYVYNHHDGWLSLNEEVIFHDLISTDDEKTMSLEYPITTERYAFRIENFSQNQASLNFIEEVLYNGSLPTDKGNGLEATLKELQNAVEAIGVGNHTSKAIETKQPVTTLKFKQLLSGRFYNFSVGPDGRYYVIDDTNTVKVYDDIINDAEPAETGVTFTHRVGHFKVLRDGIVVTQNNLEENTCQVLFSNDIHSEFTEVYTSPNDDTTYLSVKAFGLDTYDNGLNTYVLLGIYGRGEKPKDLLLSRNGGRTFEVIKQTNPVQVGETAHFHDVKIDTYHGILWVSEGDTANNHNISFSRDFGETWEVLADNRQPTAIMPFPKQVIFGRDSGATGFDSVVKPVLNDDDMTLQAHYELKKGEAAIWSYAHSPLIDGKEGYVSFSNTEHVKPVSIVATGDGGETMYQVYLGENAGNNYIQQLLDIDEKHIFVQGRSYAEAGNLYYSERIKWE